MTNRWKNLLSSLLALCLLAGLLAGCGVPEDIQITYVSGTMPTLASFEEEAAQQTDDGEGSRDYFYSPSAPQLLKDKEYGADKDYISLYERFGKEVSIADVEADKTGLAWLNAPDGNKYELGLDFLTMAMVYNTDPAGSQYSTEEEVYAAWWRYYVTRWNRLLPEIPLYCNEYYDVFSAKITGVQEHPTNPYWGPAQALLYWASEKEDNSLILGSTDELTGLFRFAAFGKSSLSTAAGDKSIQDLCEGLEIVSVTADGRYTVNPTVVRDFQRTENADGTVTFTFTLHDDLKFSDGSPVTAKNYLYSPMVFSTPVAGQAAGRDHRALAYFVGYDEFADYDGTEGSGSRVMTGLRLLGDDCFSCTLKAEYHPYFYALAYAAFSPTHRALWMGAADVADDGAGCCLTDDFYENAEAQAELIRAHAAGADPSIPCAGPYCFDSWDEDAGRVILRRNPYFKGNYAGAQPRIETVLWQHVEQKTQLEELTEGRVDYLADITVSSTEKSSNGIADLLPFFSIFVKSSTVSVNDLPAKVISIAESSDGAFRYTHYSRAGCGVLAFRCDLGPAQFPEVRQAIALCMDRPAFAQEITGGLGSVVDGPYSTDSWMYREAVKQGLTLDPYAVSLEQAVQLLEEGGWIYDKDGNPYTEGVRYKKIPGEYGTKSDIEFKSADGKYETIRHTADFYMPLVINWCCAEDIASTKPLLRSFEQNELLEAAGIRVCHTLDDLSIMWGEYYQDFVCHGYYYSPYIYCAFNFTVRNSSPMYDYSYNMTIDPDLYDNYSAYYIKDTADIWWIN